MLTQSTLYLKLPTMQEPDPAEADIASLREFNRVYTQRLGLLNARLDGSAFSLTEARILYELAHRPSPTAAEIGRALNVDAAQLSRTLKRFERAGLLTSRMSDSHAKHRLLGLTDLGRDSFAELDRATRAAIGSMLGDLPPRRRRRLIEAASSIVDSLSRPKSNSAAVVLRDLKPGDLGLVVSRQAILYAEEYGWDFTYEALVAEILAAFVRTFDPSLEQAWIAEVDGTMAGSIFLMRSPSPGIAKLRLLYVEPGMRGMGIGGKLVHACIGRARAVGYRKLELWTNSVLVSARRIYEAAGFRLTEETPHRSFGQDLVGQIWTLDLA